METTDLSRFPAVPVHAGRGRLLRAAGPLRFAPGEAVPGVTGPRMACGTGAGTGAAAGTGARKQCPTPDHARPIRRLGDLLVRLLTIAEGIPSIAGHPDYLTAADTAALLRITPDFLDTLRHRGEGPPGIRLGKGGLRFYRRDVEEWQRARLEGRPGGRG